MTTRMPARLELLQGTLDVLIPQPRPPLGASKHRNTLRQVLLRITVF